MEKKYIIKESERNILAEYLASKPYKEVAQGIKMLAELEELGENELAD